jgi:transposase
VHIRQISRTLKISRNAVKQVIKGIPRAQRQSRYGDISSAVREAFTAVGGNVVRVQEILEEKGHKVPYSTLTRIVRDLELREDRKKRAGVYTFGPGEETQHDTSPHQVVMGDKKVKAQCAGLVLAYSRKLFVQYYPAFTRFEERVFLDTAFRYMEGTCPRCTIDNTSVIVACGSGPDAEIAPEMVRFGEIYGVRFVPHAVGDPNRKARIEKNFAYVAGNFLAGRAFADWHDLNEQALTWCTEVANRKVKRSLGMNPDEAYLMEKPYLTPLPPYIPPVYQTFYRTVDVEGYVHVDTNRYSVPERLTGEEVEVHKLWDRIEVFFKNRKVADHPRLIDKRETKVTASGHHEPLHRRRTYEGPCAEEKALTGQHEWLDAFVKEVKHRSAGRGVRSLRRLLELKRTYPPEAFEKACGEALHYGLYDLARLEQMILTRVAGDFFTEEL